MRTNGSAKVEPSAIVKMPARELDERIAELGLKYGPCWVTLLDEDDNELLVMRRVARLLELTSTQASWSLVHFLAPVPYVLGPDRRRKRTIYAAAAATPCGKPNRLGSIVVRPEELVSIAPRVSVDY